ncbi:MAG: hypothetical protein EP336_13895 [Rhodobacteraceae bacterium]|nr:MAG: hypothetical protein EP336_13895 [Paracoccaceae bacterium]
MSAQIFSIEALKDGGAKLALNSKHDTHSGIRRVSCEISPDELLQLVVYAEALSLRQHLGHPASSSLSVDGLELSYDPATRDLHVVRQAGYSRQTARIPVEIFQAEMAGMTEICMARAEASKHAAVLTQLLAECAGPEEIDKQFGQDEADLILHQLREIAFLLLVREASTRGSALGRKLRGKRSQDQVRETVREILLELAMGFAPVSA